MKRLLDHLPALAVIAAVVALALHGPIPQWPDYHDFADSRTLLGLPNALDVLSNVGFALVGAWGWVALWPRRADSRIAHGWHGWLLLLMSLMLTAIGSSFYHLAPDNFRLLFDRLPIALACAGVLAAVWAESHRSSHGALAAALLAVLAIAAVLWWYATELSGAGDLRAYLLIQAAPLALIPLWQAIHHAPRAERIAFALAIGGYVLAKAAELHDQQLLAVLGIASGHTLKHLLATAAAAIVVHRVVVRVRGADAKPAASSALRAWNVR